MSGERKIAGAAVSIFALRREGGSGSGDFGCLPLAAGLASLAHLTQIRLTDVFDSVMEVGQGPIFPVCINLDDLPPLAIRAKADEYATRAAELEAAEEFDYDKVYNLKMHVLQDLYRQDGDSTLASDAYHAFWRANRSWLDRYAAYCTLRHKYGTGEARFWSEPAYERLLEDAHFIREYSEDLRFHCYVQFLLSQQLASALEAARSLEIEIIPCGSGSDWEDDDLAQMQPWEAEEVVRQRLHEGASPVILPLDSLLAVTSLGPGLTLEKLLAHRALLGCIAKMIDESLK
ncbi:MAG: 4-alpha-glucanotransferase [Bacteroidales bacterium]|nr:4-alpha-glucanotransferase [Bacteroidales bacterium]